MATYSMHFISLKQRTGINPGPMLLIKMEMRNNRLFSEFNPEIMTTNPPFGSKTISNGIPSRRTPSARMSLWQLKCLIELKHWPGINPGPVC